MTDQEINRAMAEALTRMHFDQRLLWQSWRCVICQPDEPIFTSLNETHLKGARWMEDDAPLIFRCPWKNHDAVEGYEPHDFTEPRYLLAALEAWRDALKEWRTWHLWSASWDPIYMEPVKPIAMVGKGDVSFRMHGETEMEALRNAFAAALGVGE